MNTHELDSIFNPRTIAVIGATSREGSVGRALMQNLLGKGYGGAVYPINPNKSSILGVKAYTSIGEVNDKIDLAVIAIPAETVLEIVKECGEAGVRGILIISAGFGETGEDALSFEIREYAHKYGMRIIGPKCLGFMRPKLGLNVSFATKMAPKGNIAFISQSGSLGSAILDMAVRKQVGFSYFVSVGGMIDIGIHDLIDYFGNDQDTSSIVIYMESLVNARKFLSAARAFARTKPIIVLKAGKSLEGVRAVKLHTGTDAGNDDVFDAAFKRAGIIRVDSIEGLFDCAHTLAKQPKPRGNRLCIITNGSGVLSTDYLMWRGGRLAQLSEQTISKLGEHMPKAWSRSNPVGILEDADPKRYKHAVEICMDDKNVDGILVLLTPQAITDPTGVARELTSIEIKKKKTILAVWMGEDDVIEGREILENGNIPVFTMPNRAVKCFMHMYNYSKNIELLYETPATIPHAFSPKIEESRTIIQKAHLSGREVLDDKESSRLLENFDITLGNRTGECYELSIRCEKDRIFGPVIRFGAGGDIGMTYNDQSVGLPPLNMHLAKMVMKETRIYDLLKEHKHIGEVQFILYKVAYLMMGLPEIEKLNLRLMVNDEVVASKPEVIIDKGVLLNGQEPDSHLSISAYPKEYVSCFTIEDGTNVLFRPIKPEDEPLEKEMFESFSERSQRFRFFQLIKEINHELLIQYTHIDYDREIAIVALSEDESKMIGMTRFFADSRNIEAEFAIIVRDEYHHKGLGNKLMDYILDIAKKRGVKLIHADVLRENTAMLHMFSKRGFKVEYLDDVCHVELEIER